MTALLGLALLLGGLGVCLRALVGARQARRMEGKRRLGVQTRPLPEVSEPRRHRSRVPAAALPSALAAAGGLTGALVASAASAPMLPLIALGALVGFCVEPVRRRRARQSRVEAISRSLPDALDLLGVAVAAGLALDAALDRLVTVLDGPLASELAATQRDIALGLPRAQALRNLATRTGVPELASFAAAVTQADLLGSPLIDTLAAQARTQRELRALRVEERAQRLPVLQVFPLVLCILPALLVVVIGPAVVSLMEDGVLG